MAFQRHVWSAFDFSEIGPKLTYNDLRIVWLKMHSVLLKPTFQWILRKGLLAQIEFKPQTYHEIAFQRHVWSAFDFSEIGLELPYNDLRIVRLKRLHDP